MKKNIIFLSLYAITFLVALTLIIVGLSTNLETYTSLSGYIFFLIPFITFLIWFTWIILTDYENILEHKKTLKFIMFLPTIVIGTSVSLYNVLYNVDRFYMNSSYRYLSIFTLIIILILIPLKFKKINDYSKDSKTMFLYVVILYVLNFFVLQSFIAV